MIRSLSLIFCFFCPVLTGFSQIQRIWVMPTPGNITTHFLSTGKYQSQQLMRILNNSESLFFFLRSGINLTDDIPGDPDPDHKHFLDFHLKGWLKNENTFWKHPEKGYFEDLKPLMEQLLHK